MKNRVQKWEIAGIPAALFFGAAHNLGWLDAIGVTPERLPDFMVVAFVAMASVRLVVDYARKRADT